MNPKYLDLQHLEHVLGLWSDLVRLHEIYDDESDLSSAITAAIPDFEYPDWSHLTVGEMARRVKARMKKCAPHRVIVTVRDGVAEVYAADPGVEVHIHDFDNINAGDAPCIPDGWDDLAAGLEGETK